MHHWYNNINSQLDATIIILLIISISSTGFGRQFRPSSGALDCVYSLCYKVPTMLPAGIKLTVYFITSQCFYCCRQHRIFIISFFDSDMSHKIANAMHYCVSIATLPILIELLTKKYLGNNKKSTLCWAVCLCQQYLLQFWQRNADQHL